jgi:hypothetical protein
VKSSQGGAGREGGRESLQNEPISAGLPGRERARSPERRMRNSARGSAPGRRRLAVPTQRTHVRARHWSELGRSKGLCAGRCPPVLHNEAIGGKATGGGAGRRVWQNEAIAGVRGGRPGRRQPFPGASGLRVDQPDGGRGLVSRLTSAGDAQTAGGALVSLLREHGAPLAIRADADSAFTAQEVQELPSPWSPFFLLSPLGMPSYNGSCEAGTGSLKTRVHHLAARHGRPGEWSCDDVEAAGVQPKHTPRPPDPRFPNVAWNR